MKIKNDLVTGLVKEIKPKIFGVSVKDRYQRAMLFCRYQEFYESPYKEIRGKEFSWEHFMHLYTKKTKQELFTYPKDWSGFNIPSKVIEKAITTFSFKTWGRYDEIMSHIWHYCENYPLKFEKPRTKWYLIGYGGNDIATLKHEVAHGFYYTNRNYKSEMDHLISKIGKANYNKIKNVLIDMGYVGDKKIIDDEIQAYMSTGVLKQFSTPDIKNKTKEFVSVFNKYYEEQ